jgi:outer membrane protein assembly factor BamE (lipoprotein component of BamABCDE complex)
MHTMRWRAPVTAALIGAALALSGALAGCASGGTEVKPDQLAKFKTGETTEADVIAALGEPNSTSTLADGSKIDTYTHTAASVKATSFIPVVGMLMGGSSTNVHSVTFSFDAKGILKSISSNAMNNEANTGLLNQK